MVLPSRAASMMRRTCSVGNTIAASRSTLRGSGLVSVTATPPRAALGLAVDRVEQLLIEMVLRGEAIALGGAVLPGVRAQVAEADLALAVVELRHLPELERIALAGAAGEIVRMRPRAVCTEALPRDLAERELVDRPMRRQVDPLASAPEPAARPTPAPRPRPAAAAVAHVASISSEYGLLAADRARNIGLRAAPRNGSLRHPA